MSKPKKIINDPKKVVDELLEGLVLANHGRIRKIDGTRTALVKNEIPGDKVALLIGGGSGHEPLFHGFVGDNMADGAACGDIFAAPTPDVVYEAIKGIDQGNGVIIVYGNYAGDVMNFDMGAEMAEDDGIKTETILIWDDVASAPPDRKEDRRGIAGDLPIVKLAGAITAVEKDFDACVRLITKARDNTRSMGVAVAAGSIPETGEPTFELPEDEIEIGMGVHGEPGVSRRKLMNADDLTTDMVERILGDDLEIGDGDEVVLFVNDLGATTMMECLIVLRRIHQIFAEKGIKIYDTVVGKYITCQEMAGFSITLVKMDHELKKYWDMSSDSVGYTKLAK